MTDDVAHPQSPGAPVPRGAAVEELLTAKDVARWLNVSAKTVYSLGRDGTIPAVHVGSRTVRFRRADVERVILSAGEAVPPMALRRRLCT